MTRTLPLWVLSLCSLCLCGSSPGRADTPVASYIFPAGGQRGATVKVRVGGLCLYDRCNWELLGKGVTASKQLTRTSTLWFEGPRLPLPDSQRQEDYPQDMAGEVVVAKGAALGLRQGRVWTSEGASAGLAFMVGELPEVVEQERDGEQDPVQVKLPVTINGRIFPREDIDVWSFDVKAGQQIACEVHAARLGSPLDSRLEVRDPDGKRVAENDDARGTDSFLVFTAAKAGKYTARIEDSQRQGSQRHVYRLTISDGPYVAHVYPLGGRKGVKTRFTLAGANVPKEAEASLDGDTHAFTIDGKATNAVPVDVDDLPEYLEAKGPTKVSLPCVVNGRIERPGEADVWRFDAKKGHVLQLTMRGGQLNSPLAGVVEILDANDKVLLAGAPRAAEVIFTAPADATYAVRLRDQFRTRGGPAFAYRLRMAEAKPDFRLVPIALAHTVVRGKKSLPFRVNVTRSGGFGAAVALKFDGLPAGVKASPATVGPGQAQVDVIFEAAKDAAIGPAHVRITGSATIDKQPAERAADDLLVGVGLEVPFKIIGKYDLRLIPRGTVYKKKFTIQRNGFAGPLEVRLADKQSRHLQGVTGPTLTLAADATEFEYPVTLPPWMETGRTSRACVMAVGKVKIDGVEHTVSFSSQGQNEQMIAVVETGQLALEVSRRSLAVKPGGNGELGVSVRRGKGLSGDVKVELIAPADSGVSAQAVTIAADRTEATLTVKLAEKGKGRPVQLRATLQTPDGPVTAEATAEVVAE